MLVVNHASSQPNKEILIVSAELTKMRLTVIKDFVKVMQGFGIYEDARFLAGTLYKFPNGSFIKFIGLDKSDMGKGLRSDLVYFNECNKIDVESYRQIATRAKQVLIDYNPDAKFFVHSDIIPREDCQYLQLTFNDNEQLSEEERGEILRYKTLGYNEAGEVINKYWANKWQVYGLGNNGAIDGVVFENWAEVQQIPAEAKLKFYGLDFGFSVSKFAVVEVYQYNASYYLKQMVYKNNLTNPQAAEAMKAAGYKAGKLVYCDSAEPKSIQELKNNGINAVACESKRDIKAFAIQKLNTSKFYVLNTSEDLINELNYYIWDEKTGKPQKSDADHLMDAMQYAIGSAGKYSGTYI